MCERVTFTVEENVLSFAAFYLYHHLHHTFVNYKFSCAKVERLEHDRRHRQRRVRGKVLSFTMKTTQKHANSLREKYNFLFYQVQWHMFPWNE